MDVKAAVAFEAGKPLSIETVQLEGPREGEVLVEIKATGICHTDEFTLSGADPEGLFPAILGHEGAGVVAEVGPGVTNLKPGDHVITCLSVFCGHCEQCLTGHMSLCASPETKRGPDDEPRLSKDSKIVQQFASLSSFAEQMLVHEHAIVKIREDMPLDRAALIGCGVTTGVGAVFHTAAVEPGSTVAVIGCGGIGLSIIQGARLAGANKIIAIDVADNKLEMAQNFGATHIIDILRGSRSKKVLSRNHDQLPTYNIGREFSKKQWQFLARQFIQQGLLNQDMEHGSLKLAPAAYDFLKGQ